MLDFTRRHVLKRLDKARIERAIADAERRTSGEIRVAVAPLFWGNVEKAAQRAFDRLGMQRTRERNGILFFIVPARRAFVILGDTGIHAHVGAEFWQELAALVTPYFRRREYTEGILAGIDGAARRLADHFPYDPELDRNELPNEVVT